MNEATQAAMILLDLQRGHKITPLEALDRYGCFRLGARIYDLKKQGHDINKEMVEVGEGKRVAQYALVRSAQ